MGNLLSYLFNFGKNDTHNPLADAQQPSPRSQPQRERPGRERNSRERTERERPARERTTSARNDRETTSRQARIEEIRARLDSKQTAEVSPKAIRRGMLFFFVFMVIGAAAVGIYLDNTSTQTNSSPSVDRSKLAVDQTGFTLRYSAEDILTHKNGTFVLIRDHERQGLELLATSATGQVLWQKGVPPLSTETFRPNIYAHGDTLLVAGKAGVVAYTANTGRMLWQYATDADNTLQLSRTTQITPAIKDNTWAVLTNNKRMVGINLANGVPRWEVPLTGNYYSPNATPLVQEKGFAIMQKHPSAVGAQFVTYDATTGQEGAAVSPSLTYGPNNRFKRSPFTTSPVLHTPEQTYIYYPRVEGNGYLQQLDAQMTRIEQVYRMPKGLQQLHRSGSSQWLTRPEWVFFPLLQPDSKRELALMGVNRSKNALYVVYDQAGHDYKAVAAREDTLVVALYNYEAKRALLAGLHFDHTGQVWQNAWHTDLGNARLLNWLPASGTTENFACVQAGGVLFYARTDGRIAAIRMSDGKELMQRTLKSRDMRRLKEIHVLGKQLILVCNRVLVLDLEDPKAELKHFLNMPAS